MRQGICVSHCQMLYVHIPAKKKKKDRESKKQISLDIREIGQHLSCLSTVSAKLKSMQAHIKSKE